MSSVAVSNSMHMQEFIDSNGLLNFPLADIPMTKFICSYTTYKKNLVTGGCKSFILLLYS